MEKVNIQPYFGVYGKFLFLFNDGIIHGTKINWDEIKWVFSTIKVRDSRDADNIVHTHTKQNGFIRCYSKKEVIAGLSIILELCFNKKVERETVVGNWEYTYMSVPDYSDVNNIERFIKENDFEKDWTINARYHKGYYCIFDEERSDTVDHREKGTKELIGHGATMGLALLEAVFETLRYEYLCDKVMEREQCFINSWCSTDLEI